MARFKGWKSLYPILRFLIAVMIAVVLHRFTFSFLEGALYDFRVRLSPNFSTTGIVTTIAIDTKTMTALQGEPNIDDKVLLLKRLQQENPQAVIYMDDPRQWGGDLATKIKFSSEAAKLSNFFFTTDQLTPAGQSAETLPNPFNNLSLAPAPITRDQITFAGDKVTRRILLAYEGQLVLQPILANLHNRFISPHEYRGSYESDGSYFTYINYHSPGTYKSESYVDIRDGKFVSGSFKDKIVLIGRDNQLDSEDYVLTPYSRSPLSMSKLEAQANIIDTLIENKGIKTIPSWLHIVLTILVSYSTILIVWSARPVSGIFLLFAQALTLFVVSYVLFAFVGLWVTMVHPLLAIFVSYYFFIPYRLIVENKKNWEYAQKNRLLTQVEELKTNFLSMMSHDLKTPIARIQGMAELALSDSPRLTPEQQQALKTILNSSDELGHFIGSILDLSRIETKEVKLRKSSRDINSLIKEVIGKYEFLSKGKNITIETELEPLFSIKIDVDLIRQVISNLLENAIKYSPANSKITLKTHEENGSVSFSIHDEGPGIMKDDIDNIFLKFYRSKSAKLSPIKGSGLGLYLARYFVELHNGSIAVETVPQKGSTFTVQLPI